MKKLPKKFSILSLETKMLEDNEVELTYYVGNDDVFSITLPYDYVVQKGDTLQNIRWESLGNFVRISPETECLEKLVIALSNILPKPSKNDHPAALYIDGLMEEACELLHIDLNEKKDTDFIEGNENNEDSNPTLN